MIPIAKPLIGQLEIRAVTGVLKSGQLAQGPKVALLEKKFSKLVNTKYAVATSSGTSALHTSLYALGIETGDEVITTPFTFVASANSISMMGARPVFVDIDEKTFNIDPEKIEKAINKKTKAILAVNLYGQPADYKIINKIAKKHHLLLIEDAAQSINATYNKKKSGNLADSSCFSFYATKNIMSGEGGMITTNKKRYYQKARMFRNHNQRETRYEYKGLGFNYRMTEIQAAIALVQLRRLKKITKKRQAISQKYDKTLGAIKGLVIPFKAPARTHVYHQYTLRITQEFKMTRDRLMKYLEKKGIQARVYYPQPLHFFPQFKKLGYRKGDFPVAEKLSNQVLSLPVHPLLKNQEVNYIIKTIANI